MKQGLADYVSEVERLVGSKQRPQPAKGSRDKGTQVKL